jgi:flagellar basal-body rod protein FlgB
MDLTSVPFLDILRQRMSWLSTRQDILSQNVANADTPGYTSRDLKPLDFQKLVDQSGLPSTVQNGLALTDPRHIAIASTSSHGLTDAPGDDSNIDTTGNSVSVEEEMMKVADTQAQYQAATDIYAKAIGMMRTAIDRSGP